MLVKLYYELIANILISNRLIDVLKFLDFEMFFKLSIVICLASRTQNFGASCLLGSLASIAGASGTSGRLGQVGSRARQGHTGSS